MRRPGRLQDRREGLHRLPARQGDSTEAFQTASKKAGGKVSEAIPMGTPAQVPDFTPFFQRIKDAKPDWGCASSFRPARMRPA